jgi:alginate O-acetyltransferase complex protein AlgI
MLFNSLQFAIFFPVVTLSYFALPHRWRGTMLLAASCVFYMAFVPAYIGILAVTILIDYVAGMRIEAATGVRRRHWLILSIVSTCAVLFVFKYFDFFSETIARARRARWGWSTPLPRCSCCSPSGSRSTRSRA